MPVSKDRASIGGEYPASILPWRLVAGAFLHLVLPFYFLAILVAVVRNGSADLESMLHLALRVSPALLGGYAVAAVAATAFAALVDPLLRARKARREARNPRARAERSERQLRHALSVGRTVPGSPAEAALALLANTRWNHGDPRYQALSRDLAEAIDASTRALATAAPERRPALAAMVTATIEQIAAAHADLAAADAQEDETQARIVAGYVEARYGPSKLSG